MIIGQFFKAGFLILLFFCALSDVRVQRIPNRLVLTGFVLSFLYRVTVGGWGSAAFSLLGAVITAAVLMPLSVLRMFGAGDSKLLAVVVMYAGPGNMLLHLFCIFLTGAGMSLCKMIRHRSLRRRLRYLMMFMASMMIVRETAAYDTEGGSREVLLPFAIPVLIGTVAAAAVQLL